MKNYFQKIVTLFTGYEYPESTQQEFYRWLVNEEHISEKEYPPTQSEYTGYERGDCLVTWRTFIQRDDNKKNIIIVLERKYPYTFEYQLK